MSLKHFHIFFIFLAILCTLGFSAWALLTPRLEALDRGIGWFSGILGVALVFYGIWFWKKSKLVIT
jgi:hypothetical protein